MIHGVFTGELVTGELVTGELVTGTPLNSFVGHPSLHATPVFNSP